MDLKIPGVAPICIPSLSLTPSLLFFPLLFSRPFQQHIINIQSTLTHSPYPLCNTLPFPCRNESLGYDNVPWMFTGHTTLRVCVCARLKTKLLLAAWYSPQRYVCLAQCRRRRRTCFLAPCWTKSAVATRSRSTHPSLTHNTRDQLTRLDSDLWKEVLPCLLWVFNLSRFLYFLFLLPLRHGKASTVSLSGRNHTAKWSLSGRD